MIKPLLIYDFRHTEKIYRFSRDAGRLQKGQFAGVRGMGN